MHYFEKPSKKTTVSDFHFDKCLCFAKANLKEKDFLFYKKHFRAMKQTLPIPDLIVYLDTSTDLLMKNIQKRGRAIERSLKETYLEKLRHSFGSYYLAKKRSGAPVLLLHMKEYTTENLSVSCKKIILILNDLSKTPSV